MAIATIPGNVYHGFAHEGTPWSFAWHRTLIPGATYCEGERHTVGLFAEVSDPRIGLSCSLLPGEITTIHRLLTGAVRFFELTGDSAYLVRAEDAAYYFAAWQIAQRIPFCRGRSWTRLATTRSAEPPWPPCTCAPIRLASRPCPTF